MDVAAPFVSLPAGGTHEGGPKWSFSNTFAASTRHSELDNAHDYGRTRPYDTASHSPRHVPCPSSNAQGSGG